MPIYEYHCKACQETVESERPIDARLEPAICPKCLLPVAELIISRNTFILKGTGWTGGNDPGNQGP